MRKQVKKIFNLLGFKISKLSSHNPFYIQQQLIGKRDDKLIIFDIGAYTGQIALTYNKLFSNCEIFCFEPFPETFSTLKGNVASYNNIKTYNIGLGASKGIQKFYSNSFSATNSILETHEKAAESWGIDLLKTKATVDLELTTLDDFIERNTVPKIDILKLDVQGAEHLVLKGGQKSLEKGLISILYTEIITLQTYVGQLPFEETIALIKSFGFELYNFYNFSLTSKGQLRQVDAIFINSEFLDQVKATLS